MDKESKKPNQAALIDTYNRRLSYLRVSITDQCNLNCVYCNPYSGLPKLPHTEILRYEEIERIVTVAVGLGISKVRVTGGEPLVRKGVYSFLHRLTQIDGLTDVSLTTNGVGLNEKLKTIWDAGIRRINISLDSLDRQKIKQITGHDVLTRVWKAVMSAHKQGFYPIKLNVVAIRGFNDDELKKFAELSFQYPFHVRFIEYMPIGDSGIEASQRILSSEIKAKLADLGPLIPVTLSGEGGPAMRYKFEGALGEVGFISPISHHFCRTCNRLRLTASGRLRVCLLSDRFIDLKTPLRSGCSNDELKELLLSSVRLKPESHDLDRNGSECLQDDMSAIGG
ncbi:MAG: GTP 3',8-cyclase MoaA [Deltaproteobacteria bacterium]|nr:GTP 3',8-cyclase MoaA [Deltaproteobacteria bacterium]